MRTLLALLPIPLLAIPFACSPAGERNESVSQGDTASDLATARHVLSYLGGDNGRCVSCHTATPADIKTWGLAMEAVNSTCLSTAAQDDGGSDASAGLTAAGRVDCMRDDPTDPNSSFSPHKLGLYAAGALDGEFDQLFTDAYGDQAASKLADFKQAVRMPLAGQPLAPHEWATIKAWVLRGMPQLDQAAGDAGPGDDGGTDAQADAADAAPGECTPSITQELKDHMARMKTEGWGARLADQATPMFGCGDAAQPQDCLSTLPNATDTIANGAVAQTVRQLLALDIRTEYWIRSSADGRYVGVGSGTSRVYDLVTGKFITVSAPYDPFFLRSNDGFAYASTPNGISLCKQSLLADAEQSATPRVTFSEAKCAKIGNSVYESIGSALDGNSYFMTVGPHRNDNGGNTVTHPLPAGYGSPSLTTFTPMVNDGTSYRAQATVNVDFPGEGDVMLSPSSLLAATRFSAPQAQKQAGFRVHLIKATQDAGSTSITAPMGAEVCMKGGKPEMSFDERFLAAHQYVDHSEPDQVDLPDGSSNIVVADVLTGKTYRITNMKAGQFALYPHFRADGWLYFLLRDMNAGKETVFASDVALRLGNAQ